MGWRENGESLILPWRMARAENLGYNTTRACAWVINVESTPIRGWHDAAIA